MAQTSTTDFNNEAKKKNSNSLTVSTNDNSSPASILSDNPITHHEILSSLAAGILGYTTTGSLLDSAMLAYGTHEILTGDANFVEKAAFAWAAGDVVEKTLEKTDWGKEHGTLCKVFGWAATAVSYFAAGYVSDTIEADQKKKQPAPAGP